MYQSRIVWENTILIWGHNLWLELRIQYKSRNIKTMQHSAWQKSWTLFQLMKLTGSWLLHVATSLRVNLLLWLRGSGAWVLIRYLRIIPRAWMGSESIKGLMGYWLKGHEGERNNCFSKIQLVGQKYRDKTTLASKMWFSHLCFGFQSWRFSLLVGYNI